jgi:hypothetical protein
MFIVDHHGTAAKSNLIMYNVDRRSSHGTAAQSNLKIYNAHCRSSYGTAAQRLII